MEKDYLTLKQHRPLIPSAEWKDDDYDVLTAQPPRSLFDKYGRSAL